MDREAKIEDLIPALAETMKFAAQALAQVAALGDLLIAKGVVTHAELDEALKRHPPQTRILAELLGPPGKTQ